MKNNRRYFVYTKSGRKFCIEEYGYSHTDWGNVIPGASKIEKVKSKTDDVIDASNTFITTDNGFKNICLLDKGTSPMAYIQMLENEEVDRVELDCVTYEK